MNPANPSGGSVLALSAPTDPVNLITAELMQRVIEASRSSPRKRMILPLHKSHDALLHRMLNVFQPGSYVQPHRHLDPPKAESIVVLRGAIHFVAFEADGAVARHYTLEAGTPVFGVDIEPGVYHTFFALTEDTVLFEVKNGPYAHSNDKDFAAWAPKEGDPEAAAYLEQLYVMAK